MFMWTHRRQFRQPRWNFFAQCPKFFRSKYESDENFYSYQKNIFPQIVPLYTQIAFLTSFSKIFCQKLAKFFQKKSENDEKNILTKKQPPKRSSVEVRSNFQNPAEKFSQEVRKIFANSVESEKIYNFLIKKASPQSIPLES